MVETDVSLTSLLDRAMQQGAPALLRIHGRGSISVYPLQQCYVTDIENWDVAFASNAEHVHGDPNLQPAPPSDALPLSELHWRSAYHHVQGQQSPESATWDLFQLVSWPNLSCLPEELVVPVTRICSLLWRKPTVGFLVSRVLDMPAPQALALLAVLRNLGHVVSPRGLGGGRPDAMAQQEREVIEQQAATEPVKGGTLVGKLWRRLVGR